MASWERVELKEAAGTKGAAAAAVASEGRVQAQQVEETVVAERGMAGGRWAAQQAAEGNAAAAVGWEAVGERTAETVGREVAVGRVAAQIRETHTFPRPRQNPRLGQYSTAARRAAARVEVERQKQGSLYPNWVAEKACPAEGVVAVMVAVARAVTWAVGELVVARARARAAAMREAASTEAAKEVAPVVGTEVLAMERLTAIPEDGVAATGVVVRVEATEEATERRVG